MSNQGGGTPLWYHVPELAFRLFEPVCACAAAARCYGIGWVRIRVCPTNRGEVHYPKLATWRLIYADGFSAVVLLALNCAPKLGGGF